MGNIILDNNLGLNLYIVPTAYCIIIISNNQEEVRRRFLVESWSIFRLETTEYQLSLILRLSLQLELWLRNNSIRVNSKDIIKTVSKI